MSTFGIRGVIEGFYGKPWTHVERIDMINFLEKAKLNTYFLAPKDEPGHRRSWQDLRPDSELVKLRELVAHATSKGITFGTAVSPGQTIIYSDSADKATRFIMNCNQKKIPLVFLQDVTGFMVGSRSEQGGIIKDGAKMVNVVANSVVPKFTIVIGNSYGAGNYAMCGKAYDPRLIYAWPSAKIAVMGGSQAAKVLLQIKEASLKAKGEEITKEKEDELLKEITDRYDSQTTPYYAASRLWVDGIIDPLETRKLISMGIEAANQSPIQNSFNPGILQT